MVLYPLMLKQLRNLGVLFDTNLNWTIFHAFYLFIILFPCSFIISMIFLQV